MPAPVSYLPSAHLTWPKRGSPRRAGAAGRFACIDSRRADYLLGLIKHQTAVELGYFGVTFGRPSPDQPPWDESDPNSDMFTGPDESRELITGLYRRAWAYADVTISELPLGATGHVPWWPAETNEVTLHQVLAPRG